MYHTNQISLSWNCVENGYYLKTIVKNEEIFSMHMDEKINNGEIIRDIETRTSHLLVFNRRQI